MNKYSIEGIYLFRLLIPEEFIDMCAYRVLNELGDCAVQFEDKYGVIFDMTDL